MTWKRPPPRVKIYDGDRPTAPREPHPAALRPLGPSTKHVEPIPKQPPYRSEAYRRLVAALACAHCRRPGPSQCAHGDEGKGLAMKSSDLTCFPLCADEPGRRGCHSMIGASGMFTREQRRALEQTYAAQTRKTLGRP